MNTQLTHGRIIFVEPHPKDETGKKVPFEKLKWHTAMTNETNLLQLHVNVEDVWADKIDAVIQVKISKDKTVQQLAEVISRKIKLPTTEFSVKRQNVGEHLRFSNLTIAQACIYSGA